MVAMETETELRFITVFSVIATLLITQFVAHSLTAPLDEMTRWRAPISHGDYTRRVRGADRRDELGDLAATINRMADDLEARTSTARSWSPTSRTSCARPSRRCARSWRTSSTASPPPTRRPCGRR